MSFWSSLSKLGHLVEKKVEQTVKHVANDVKKVEKTIQQAVQQVEKKVEPVVKQVVKDTVHISQKAKEAFHQAEKKAEQMGKHVAHEVKQAEKAIQNVEKKVEHAAKQAVRDTVHISEKAQKAFHEAEKKTEKAIKHVVHDGKKAVSETVHTIGQKIKQEIKETGKAIERDTRQLEKKAEHVTKQAVHDIINAGQKIEQAARQVAKNAEKSWHGLTKHPMESTVEFVRGAGDAIVQDITLDKIHRSYHSPHPVAYESGKMAGHAVSTIAGMIETSGSEALEVGGASLTATGEGAFVGVPVMVMAGEGMAYGQAETSLSFNRLVKSAEELYQRMSRSEGGSGGVAKRTPKATQGMGKAEVLKSNKANGAAFEKNVQNKLSQTQNELKQQITIKTESGVKTRVDFIGKDKQTGQLKITEAKSSHTAPLTKNQKQAFPEIEKSGATVVGKGKEPYTGGTQIPPTKVEVVRLKAHHPSELKGQTHKK
ncbi:hypothetical protein [Anoxybacteroides amylolyticum]|uniref:Uncharacterized protein n=1 Tax=Anoxybacteroides amylolyticum TaxID=294699 RepID=A0A160F523_9BACL|nr:hypothetical protein [Anoxybacillus amylolyticus]ANB60833.1 hypothetical protein GFC30_764 [Anoxybacillus amylolyticus]